MGTGGLQRTVLKLCVQLRTHIDTGGGRVGRGVVWWGGVRWASRAEEGMRNGGLKEPKEGAQRKGTIFIDGCPSMHTNDGHPSMNIHQ